MFVEHPHRNHSVLEKNKVSNTSRTGYGPNRTQLDIKNLMSTPILVTGRPSESKVQKNMTSAKYFEVKDSTMLPTLTQ